MWIWSLFRPIRFDWFGTNWHKSWLIPRSLIINYWCCCTSTMIYRRPCGHKDLFFCLCQHIWSIEFGLFLSLCCISSYALCHDVKSQTTWRDVTTVKVGGVPCFTRVLRCSRTNTLAGAKKCTVRAKSHRIIFAQKHIHTGGCWQFSKTCSTDSFLIFIFKTNNLQQSGETMGWKQCVRLSASPLAAPTWYRFRLVGRNLRRHARGATAACRDLSAVKFRVDQRASRLPTALKSLQRQQQQLMLLTSH